MTTPTGTIKFSDITSEFGTPTGKNLGAFRVNQTIGDRQWPLDEGVPTSGTIKFSELRGKTCNVVVDYAGGVIVSDGTSISRIDTVVQHLFNNATDTTISISPPPSSGINVVPQAADSADPPYDSFEDRVSVEFDISRSASKNNTITFTPVKPGFQNVTFSRDSDGSGNITRSIRPLLTYRVTGPGDIRILDDGSTRRWGRRIGLDDGGGSGGDDNDYNDLTLRVPGNRDITPGWNNPGGIFYKSGGVIYFVYYPSIAINTDSRKHYLVTFSDGTTIPESDTTVSSIDVFPNLLTIDGELSTYTASGSLESITVSKKLRVSANSFKLWFYGEADIERNPEDCPGNSFCRNFTISRNALVPSSSALTAKSAYENVGVVVGGFKSRQDIGSGTKKVYHLIRTKVGGGLNSGSWEPGTVLNFIITSLGKMYGRGGKGGTGGRQDTNATNPPNFGGNGGDALTLQYNAKIIIEEGGELRGGGGGGGGGGYSYVGGDDTRSAGGGGGGGRGFPGGTGGAGGPQPAPSGRYGGRNSAGGSGFNGSDTNVGIGGNGGGPGHWNPRSGGNGGSWATAGQAGENGSNTGGPGGGPGKAIAKAPEIVAEVDNRGGSISGSV